MNLKQINNKFNIFSPYLFIVIGIIGVSIIYIEANYVSKCFPSLYENNELFLIANSILIIGGLLKLVKYNLFKKLLAIYIILLIIDIIAKIVIYNIVLLESSYAYKTVSILVEFFMIGWTLQQIIQSNTHIIEQYETKRNIYNVLDDNF